MIKKQGVAVDKLARRIATKKIAQKKYTKGNAQEKVWLNFQVTKDLKRTFNDTCIEHNINRSAFLRGAIKLLIHFKGDSKKALTEIKKQMED